MPNGIRINNLNQATSLNDTDTITIIQDNENKKASVSLLDKDGTYAQSVVNTILDLVTTSKANVETTKQAIDEKFGYDEFSTQIVTSQAMSSIGVSDDGSYDVSSQVQDGFMESAILSGSTKYRDIDTGDILDTFEEGRNLKLVSVKMPILTTTGKNLLNPSWESYPFYHKKGTTLTLSTKDSVPSLGGNLLLTGTNGDDILFSIDAESTVKTMILETDVRRISNFLEGDIEYQLELGSVATSYEPYKSSILSCNEDVELGSVGEVKDELNLLTGQLTQRTETRAHQEGDESNSEVITDMVNTRYKLPKESIKTVDLNSSNGDVKTPVTYKNGYILLQSDGLIPELHYSLPISYSGVIAQNTMTNLKHSWRLDELEIMAYASIVNSQYESLLLVATAETNEFAVSTEYVPDESLYNMLKVLVDANALVNADEKINVFYLYGKLSDEMYIDLIMGDGM